MSFVLVVLVVLVVLFLLFWIIKLQINGIYNWPFTISKPGDLEWWIIAGAHELMIWFDLSDLSGWSEGSRDFGAYWPPQSASAIRRTQPTWGCSKRHAVQRAKRRVACPSPQANFDTHPPPRTKAQILTKHHADIQTEIAHMQEVAQLQPSVSTLDQITRTAPWYMTALLRSTSTL